MESPGSAPRSTGWIEWIRTRTARAARRETLLTLSLLLLLSGSLMAGMADTIRGIGIGLLWPIVCIGLALGWALASSRLPGWVAAVGSLAAGLVLLLLHIGQLGGPLATVLAESARLVWRMARRSIPPDTGPVSLAWLRLCGDTSGLLTRLRTWLFAVVGGQGYSTVALPFDPVVSATLWGLALWGTVVWASWAVRRHARPALGVTPAIALLAASLGYVRGQALYLLPMLASALTLKAVMVCDSRRRYWEQVGADYASRIRANTARTAFGLSLGLMTAAAITPSVSVSRIADYVCSLPQEQAGGERHIARRVGLEPQPGPANANTLVARASAGQRGDLPSDHLIGSGPELSEQVVMVVSLESTHPATPGDAAYQAAPHYYWRSLTYDRYTGRGWATGDVEIVDYAAGRPAISVTAAAGRLLRQEVRLAEDSDGLLFSAGSLVAVDRDYQIAWRTRPDPEETGDAFGATTRASTYRADSIVSAIDETVLRAAGQDYPAGIVERYLSLPDTVPDRVFALARDLTATEPTAYDRALAIQGYLRGFPYMLDLPAAPLGRDVADYFLFDLKRGYCDYYATAMVVLARAAGLPARLVTGYASGILDKAEARYVVTEEHAHSWVEIYFPIGSEAGQDGPGHNWIEFEPTANRPAIERPSASLPGVPSELQKSLEPITAHRVRARRVSWVRTGGAFLLLMLGAVLGWVVVDGWTLRRLPATDTLTSLYRRLCRYGRWLDVHPRRGDTLHEFAAALAARMSEVSETPRWGRLLLSVPAEICWLTDLYAYALYGLNPRESVDQAQAIQTWRWLRRRFWLATALCWVPWLENGNSQARGSAE